MDTSIDVIPYGGQSDDKPLPSAGSVDSNVAKATNPIDPIKEFILALTSDPRFMEHYRPGTRGNIRLGMGMYWDENLNAYLRGGVRMHYISQLDEDKGVLVEMITDNREVTVQIGHTVGGLQSPQLTGPLLTADDALEQLALLK
tara:strand:+ start:313 stop:744 length:432 start_codon:yes stop_codon:yes gene_type:complete